MAADVPREFERDSVFGEYFRYLNFVKANVVSAEDGLDGHGREASTALGARVIAAANVPHVAVDAEIVRGMLDLMPAQDGYAIVFVPLGTLGTGGGGVATVGGRNPRTMIHEWGHAFVGLGDEYAVYTGLHAGVSDGINVAASDDPERVPWVHFIAAGVPGVGVYEGANGQVRGAWRPTASGCRMNDGEFFCPVCREALILRIHEHVDPIDEARVRSSPGIPPEGELGGEDPHEFEVVVLRPDSHVLEVSWWILSAEDAPAPRDHTARPRTLRGPLAALTAKPAKRARSSRNGVHRFRVSPRQLDPGRYRVVCRVRDTTQLRGKRFPWVLRDERGLLESERGWWIEVED